MATRDTTAPKLAEVAARIQAHLKRLEKDPAHKEWCTRVVLKMPSAVPRGAYVTLYTRPSASPYNVPKSEALEYLQWLDEGNVGLPSERHWPLMHARALDKRETPDDEDLTDKVYPITIERVPTDVYRLTWEEFKFLLVWCYEISGEQASEWVRELGCGLQGSTQVVEVVKGEFEDYAKWKETYAPPVLAFIEAGLPQVLRDAANRGAIPEGLYILSE